MSRSHILFLDDDPRRAAVFLAQHPDAIWVTTAEQCLECLAEHWDDVNGGGKVQRWAGEKCGA